MKFLTAFLIGLGIGLFWIIALEIKGSPWPLFLLASGVGFIAMALCYAAEDDSADYESIEKRKGRRSAQ